ncbi:MAG: FprA family A-type flavoprotein [Lachnospiraceae bacterium]|nr:FprA family A-type flavoprotein [Candidatus Fimimorpha excrementavium]
MYCTRNVTNHIHWVGGSDHRLALFENLFPIPRGVAYNSYVILDEKTALVDTVDASITRQFLENVAHVLNGRPLDYMIINHMEPDHCANIEELVVRYPDVKIVATAKAIQMIRQFYDFDLEGRTIAVKENDTLSLGSHTLHFVTAPMVHWPEVMMTYESSEKVLFSADAFGSFGALDGNLFNDEVNFESEWLEDARRYYSNIVGKYGPQVQAVLKKASGLDISVICPLHGPVWRNNLAWFIDKYDKWSRYEPEEQALVIFYGSIYGNTESAATVLASRLSEAGIRNIKLYDVSSTHVSYLVSEAWRCSHIIFASPTYNMNLYPPMEAAIHDLKALNLQNRTVAVVDNGTWANVAGKNMRAMIGEMKNMTMLDNQLSLASSLKEEQTEQLDQMVEAIVSSFNK